VSPELDDIRCARLVAVADGAATEDALDEELRALIAEQQSVAALVRGAAAQERAPLALRMAIDEQRSATAQRRRRAPFAAALAGAVAVAAALLALVVGGGGGGGAAPSLAAVAALATQVPAAAAPAPLPTVDGVRFPDWRDRRGWRAVGVREDRVAGRRALTVTYAKGPKRVVYTIVAGDAPAWNEARPKLRRIDGRTVVTWRRGGRACVLSATDVPAAKLLALVASQK
jgi:hypothetical protein